VVEGELEAADEATLVRTLQGDGLMPIRTSRVGRASSFFSRSAGGNKRLSQKQVTHFTRELATLLEAGLTLDRSLQILSDLSDDPRMADLLTRLRERVQGGAAFSAALEEQRGVFTPLYINMVHAGEAGGVLQNVLGKVAEYLERSGELRESVRSALVYPTILVTVAGLSVAMLLMFVVPRFKQMFDDMGATLPFMTRVVVAVGDVFSNWWWAMLAAIFLLIAWIQYQLQQPKIRARWDARILRWPLFGDLVAKVETARFARTLSTLLENGLPLLSALTLVKDVISNAVISASVGEAADNLKKGKGFADPLIEQKILPPLALQMIKVGEESGALEKTLAKVADVYDQEVRVAVKQMLTLLEPILIVGLGVIVAGIIISILLSVLSANELAF
jgi:general secretion pathway protein F